MENQRWKFSPIPKIFIHYSKKSTFKNKRIFTLIEKSTTKLRCGSRSSRNCLRRLRRIYSQFSGEIGWVLKKGMRQLKIELLLLKLHQLYFFSPTFLGWLYCTGGMMLRSTIIMMPNITVRTKNTMYSKITKPETFMWKVSSFQNVKI